MPKSILYSFHILSEDHIFMFLAEARVLRNPADRRRDNCMLSAARMSIGTNVMGLQLQSFKGWPRHR
jgi:hypothetical protein